LAERLWINVREYDLPYVKRVYLSNSETLVEDKYSDWVSNKMDHVEKMLFHSCKVVTQIGPVGGKHSRWRIKANDETAHSWREDSKIFAVFDCFHADNDNAKYIANNFQLQNDAEAIGPNGRFSKEDRRFLWGSWGSRNLHSVRNAYYNPPEKYEKLCRIKKHMDPNHVFTPNAFCVGVTPYDHLPGEEPVHKPSREVEFGEKVRNTLLKPLHEIKEAGEHFVIEEFGDLIINSAEQSMDEKNVHELEKKYQNK